MINHPPNLKHQKLRAWVEEMADLCKPETVHWCDGSQAEYDELCAQMVKAGTFIKLNAEKCIFGPGSQGRCRVSMSHFYFARGKLLGNFLREVSLPGGV